MNKQCVFCKIIKKNILAKIIAKNKNAIALLDINPISNGHTIIIAKKHYSNWTTTPNIVLKDMVLLSKKVVKKLTHKLKPKPLGFNYLSNQGSIAGQMIDHVHLHIIPKYKINEGFSFGKKQCQTKKIEEIFAILQKQN